jgi:ABC-2 type transport system ATP-binding protein
MQADSFAHLVAKAASFGNQATARFLQVWKPMDPLITAVQLQNVSKTFGAHIAVDALSLEVPAGTIYGFIGPNGSGKTTTLRMIMHILHPDRGEITVLGEKTAAAANDRVGYLPEERGLYKQMQVRDLLRFYAELKGLHRPGPAIDEWLERLDLAAWANKKAQSLSKGMSQKVQFIATVIAKPRLVLLDEPFSGLDPVNAEVLRGAVLQLKREGTSVIFSTHDMAIAEKMCDFIFMIYRGRKVLDGTLESIQEAYGNDTVRVQLEGDGLSWEGLPGVAAVRDLGRWQELRMDRDGDTQQLLATLMRRAKVQHFEVTRPSLHDIFVRIARPESPVMSQPPSS